jgi:hypothetical protein
VGQGRIPLASAGCVLALAACGSDVEKLPAACSEGPAAVRSALAAAPGPVRVGGTPLSDCLTKSANADDIQLVGSEWVRVAGDLADASARHPEGAPALRLGYLVGAAHRGASDTQGIHAELVRRLDQEAKPLLGRSRALRRGLQAGRRLG